MEKHLKVVMGSHVTVVKSEGKKGGWSVLISKFDPKFKAYWKMELPPVSERRTAVIEGRKISLALDMTFVL